MCGAKESVELSLRLLPSTNHPIHAKEPGHLPSSISRHPPESEWSYIITSRNLKALSCFIGELQQYVNAWWKDVSIPIIFQRSHSCLQSILVLKPKLIQISATTCTVIGHHMYSYLPPHVQLSAGLGEKRKCSDPYILFCFVFLNKGEKSFLNWMFFGIYRPWVKPKSETQDFSVLNQRL